MQKRRLTDQAFISVNINVVNPRYVLQVSDRRLLRRTASGDWEFYADQANKMTVLRCEDAYLSIVYHGLGEIGGSRTDLWLVEQLRGIAARHLDIETVADRLAAMATNAFRPYWAGGARAEQMRHSFMMVGWHRSGNSFVYIVSNYELLHPRTQKTKAHKQFQTQVRVAPASKKGSAILTTGGAKSRLAPKDGRLINKLIRDPGADPRDVRNVIARTIQDGATKDFQISAECMSAIIEKKPIVEKGELVHECEFHSPGETSVGFMPNQVGDIDLLGIKVHWGEGIPRWFITGLIPEDLSGAQIIRELANLPEGYVSGDALPHEMDARVANFLQSLPLGLSPDQIHEAL